ncbi:MAG: exo-alpha-sialidase [Micrococcales bacterium]|nr:exo-alpha-sialidase [Micrococcales bacterium]
MITLAPCAGLLCWGPPARADLWAPPQVLTDSGTHSHVASSEDGSLLAAVWRSEAIQVSTSHTGGRLWTTPRPISPAGAVNDLKVCVRGRTIVVVYALRAEPGGIRSVTSTDAGTTWTAPVAVSGDREDFLPQVIGSADGTRVLLAWRHDDGSEHYDVQVASSADSGHTWSPVRSLSAQGFSSGVPRVGLSDDGLRGIVAWGQYEIAFRGVQTSATADGGKTWSDAVSISDPAESGDHPSLGISADGLRATIVWDGSPGVDRYIAAATSSDGGASWNAPTRVSPSGQYGEYPVVSVSSDGLRAVAAWSRYVNPDPTYEVRSAWSSDGGGSWSPDVTLSAQSADSKGPGLVLSPDGRSARMWDNAGHEGPQTRPVGAGRAPTGGA